MAATESERREDIARLIEPHREAHYNHMRGVYAAGALRGEHRQKVIKSLRRMKGR